MDGPLKIEKVVLHRLQMELKQPFMTSFGTVAEKDFFLVEVQDSQKQSGFGESVAFSAPWYTEETTETVLHMMKSFLVPLIFEAPFQHPDEIASRFRKIRRNSMAKAAVEGAIWDLYAKAQELPLSVALGGKKTSVEVGVSVGIQNGMEKLLQSIRSFLEQGYRRVKIKIKPGADLDVIHQVRRAFPDLQLMADANSAYSLADLDHLRKLDEFDLTMIEQPLGHDDLVEHAALQKEINTPVCLDESISSYHDAKQAIELGACQVINLKIGRVGGLTEAKRIHDLAVSRNIPIWCGGMLEAGVGRAHSLAISALDGFVFPGDTSASNRYWEKDIIKPEVLSENGKIELPKTAGIGYNLDWSWIEKVLVDRVTMENPH